MESHSEAASINLFCVVSCGKAAVDPADNKSAFSLRFSPTTATPGEINTCQTHAVELTSQDGKTTEADSDLGIVIKVWTGTTNGVEFFGDPQCSAVTESFTLAQASSSLTFYYKVKVPEEIVTIAAGTVEFNINDGYMDVTSTTKKATGVRFSPSTKTSVPVNNCQSHTIELVAGKGGAATPVNALTNLTGVLGVNTGTTDGVKFFSDSACSETSDSYTVAAGKSTVVIYYKQTDAEVTEIGTSLDEPGIEGALLEIEGT